MIISNCCKYKLIPQACMENQNAIHYQILLSIILCMSLFACSCVIIDRRTDAYFSMRNDTAIAIFFEVIPDGNDQTDMIATEGAMAENEVLLLGTQKGLGYNPPNWTVRIYDSSRVALQKEFTLSSLSEPWHEVHPPGSESYEVYWEIWLSDVFRG